MVELSVDIAKKIDFTDFEPSGTTFGGGRHESRLSVIKYIIQNRDFIIQQRDIGRHSRELQQAKDKAHAH